MNAYQESMGAEPRVSDLNDREANYTRGQSYRKPTNRNSDSYASDLNAGVLRDQWQDYQNRFMPVHGELFDAVLSPKLVNEQLGRVNGNVERSFEQAEQSADVNRSRMGLSDLQHDNGLDKALATTHAKNSIREAGEQRKMTAITGTANSVAAGRDF